MPKGGGADAGEVRTETAFNGRSVPVTINDARKGGGGESEVGVLLGPGAGGDADSGLLPRWAETFAEAGVQSVRYTYKTTSLEARVKLAKHLLLEAAQLPGCGSVKRWILAGHSMGARVAAAAAAQRQEVGADVIGCLLLSYPLHPPGNPDKLRDQLLLDLDVPTLIVRGSRDPFSQPAKFAATVKRMSCAHEVLDLEGGDHGLNVRGKPAAAVVAEVGAQVHAFFQPLRDASAEEPVPHMDPGPDPQPAASPAAQGKTPSRSRKGMGRRDVSSGGGESGQQQATESPAKRRRQKQRQEVAQGGEGGGAAGGEAGSVQPMKKPPAHPSAPSVKAKKPTRPSRSKKS